VDLSKIHQACVTGPNGAGKSTLLTNALSFALFGPRRGATDRIVNKQSDIATVSLVFEHGEEKWKLTRTRVRGKQTDADLAREVDGEWRPLELHGVTGVDTAIDEMVGVSRNIFMATVLLAQNGEGRFARADGARRRQMLSDILGLDRYNDLSVAAKKRAETAAAAHSALQARVAEIERALEPRAGDVGRLAEIEQRMAELEGSVETASAALSAAAERAAAAKALQQQIQSFAAEVEQAERLANERRAATAKAMSQVSSRAERAAAAVTQAQRKLVEIERTGVAQAGLVAEQEAVRARLGAIGARETEIIESGTAAKSAAESAEARSAELDAVLGEAAERLRSLNHSDATCYACHQDLPDEQRLRLIAETEEAVRVAKAGKDEALATSARSSAERDRLRGELKALRSDKERIQGELDRLQRRFAEAAAVLASKDDAVEALERAEQEHAGCLAEAAALSVPADDPADDPALSALRERLARARSELDAGEPLVSGDEAQARLRQLQREQTECSGALGALRERLAGYERLEQESTDKIVGAREAARDLEEWRVLQKAFSPRGVPNLIFAGAAAELERDVSEMMEILTEGKYRLELRTEKEQKQGKETVESLEIYAVTGTSDFPYDDLSGGEQFRVDLAVQIGLTRLLTRRSQQPIEFLIIDEGWGSLDPSGIKAMVKVLNRLTSEFPLVLTITHTPEVAAAFPTRFNVVPEADGNSYIELEDAA
jgi:exonuclease SbcC